MKKIKKIVSTLLIIILLFWVIVLVGPPMIGWHNLVVLSGSMEPALHVNDLICIAPCEMNEIKEGDIITFTDRLGGSTTHRVYGISEDGIITKGDANNDVDAYLVNEEHLIGKVKYHIPYAGKLIRLLKGM